MRRYQTWPPDCSSNRNQRQSPDARRRRDLNETEPGLWRSALTMTPSSSDCKPHQKKSRLKLIHGVGACTTIWGRGGQKDPPSPTPPPRLSEPFRTISNSKPVDFEKFNFCVGSLRQVTIGDGSLRRCGRCRKATDGYGRLSSRLATATEG